MIVFDVRPIVSFDDFTSFLLAEQKLFETEKAKLLKKYNILKPVAWNYEIDFYQDFRHEFRKLHRQILGDVITRYREFLPQKCLIIQFGSFAKHTERILSDIDFTICYDDAKTKEYECAEELIDYTLAKIFRFSIDHVHGNFQHYPKILDFYSLSEYDNFYRLQFAVSNIDYKCGPETFIENLTNIKNVRDYKTLITGFKLKYQHKKDIDSLYSIEIIENSTEHDFLSDLINLEFQNDICEGYVFRLQESVLPNPFSISQLKKILKRDCIVEFYIFMVKMRKIMHISDTYSMNIEMLWCNSLVDFFGYDYIWRLKKAFVTFIFYWNRIELSLNLRGIPLSTRCYKKFSIKEIDKILYEDWKDTTNIGNIISAKNDLMNFVKEGLLKI